MHIVVNELKQTSFACPSQWTGKAADGQEVYIRFRWGYLSVDLDGNEIFGEDVSDDLDGYMSYLELKDHLKNILIFPEDCNYDEWA